LPFIRLGEKFWYESNSHIHFGEYDPVYTQRALDQSLTNGFMVGWASFDHEEKMNSVLLAIRDKCFWKDVEILREIVWYSDKTSRNSPRITILKKSSWAEFEGFPLMTN
jgi:hypothetical protein